MRENGPDAEPVARTSPPAGYRLAFDVGGTFTDIVVVDGAGSLTIEKVLTTLEAPEVGATNGTSAALARVGAAVADVELGVHGTTLVTNAIIERRGSRTGIVTTRGLEDVLEIGLGERYDLYDLFLPFPAPLVERRLRLGVAGRIGFGDPADCDAHAVDEDVRQGYVSAADATRVYGTARSLDAEAVPVFVPQKP